MKLIRAISMLLAAADADPSSGGTTPPPSPPEGVHSDHAPPEQRKPDALRSVLERFDAEVEKARNQPSRVMRALRLAELTEQTLPEELRNVYAQLRYECYPKSEGGLGLQVDARRNPHALNLIEALRKEAEQCLRAKRLAIEVG